MIKSLLSAAGIAFSEDGRFLDLPKETYADVFDDIDSDGADQVPGLPSTVARIYTHSARIELYELMPDDAKETAFEAGLDAWGVHWTKEDRIWLPEVQRYQTLYELTYTEKTRRA